MWNYHHIAQNLQCSLSIHFDKSYTNPILFSHIFINSHHIRLLVCTWHNLQWPVKLLVVEGYRSSSRKLLQCRREYANSVHTYVPEVRVEPRSQELWDSNSISCSIVLLPLKVNSQFFMHLYDETWCLFTADPLTPTLIQAAAPTYYLVRTPFFLKFLPPPLIHSPGTFFFFQLWEE